MTVTVIIAAYNSEETIGRAVHSALSQPETAEVIVVVDGATDETASGAESVDDGTARLRVIELPENRGPSFARNLAIANAKGEYVAILDADDWFEPGRLQKMLSFGNEWDLIADDLTLVTHDTSEIIGSLLSLTDPIRGVDLKTFIWNNISTRRNQRREWGFLKPLVRRSFLNHHSIAYDEGVRLGEDFLLYAEMLSRGAKFIIVPSAGYMAQQTPGSLSRAHRSAELFALLKASNDLADALNNKDSDSKKLLRRHVAALRRKAHLSATLEFRRQGDFRGAASSAFANVDIFAYTAFCLMLPRLRKIKQSFLGNHRSDKLPTSTP